jgi:hypothetical protein
MTAALRELWEDQPTDPDMETDLGYRLDPLMAIEGSEHGDQIILLPAEEEQLMADEFLVTDSDVMVSLSDWR